MSGLVKKPTRRLIVNKTARNISDVTDIIDIEQYLKDTESLGCLINRNDILSSLNSLSGHVKGNTNVLLHSACLTNLNKIYAFNGDTKSVDFFNFKRDSKGTNVDADGKLVLVDENTPRISYSPSDGLLEGFLLEKGSMNLYRNSLCSNGVDTNWNRGYLLEKGVILNDGENFTIEHIFNNNKVYNFSFYFKLEENNNPTIGHGKDDTFTLSNLSTNVRSYQIHDFGTGIFRVSFIIENYINNGITISKIENPLRDNEVMTMTGFQLEYGEDMTSYIPTDGYVGYRLPDKITSERDIVVFDENSIMIDEEYYDIESLPLQVNDFTRIDKFGMIILESKKYDKFKYLSYFDSKK